MTKSKKSIVMRGALLRPLVIGQGALLHAGGKIYHTSRVVAIHDQSDDMVRFETLNSNYCLSMAPFPLAALQPAPDGEPGPRARKAVVRRYRDNRACPICFGP